MNVDDEDDASIPDGPQLHHLRRERGTRQNGRGGTRALGGFIDGSGNIKSGAHAAVLFLAFFISPPTHQVELFTLWDTVIVLLGSTITFLPSSELMGHLEHLRLFKLNRSDVISRPPRMQLKRITIVHTPAIKTDLVMKMCRIGLKVSFRTLRLSAIKRVQLNRRQGVVSNFARPFQVLQGDRHLLGMMD
jgi:hypothetical protein